jgi:uncharacterized membrane protein YgdD (TMEM256/DUF423 family)
MHTPDRTTTLMHRTFTLIGAVAGFLAVVFGAFAAHSLRGRLAPEMLAVFETGARYQMYHALALVLTAILFERSPRRVLAVAGWLFTVGIVLFSGSLYLLATTGGTVWGAVTPLGGVALMAGWLCLGAGSL